MKILKTHYHADILDLKSKGTFNEKTLFTRHATRAIATNNKNILLMYTKRYDDYSLPGGGLHENEDKIVGMKRELTEETGAQNIQDIKPFGIYEEFRPWYKPDFDIMHMISYCYTCSVNQKLGNTQLESYEINNGMHAAWVNIHEAIAHNIKTMASSPKKGMSIERETFLLELITQQMQHV